ncbi:S-adenosyl-L-methionine-dependent methyltransferase [Mycena galericulata]|nr:S-adenosyl-L-methionine-dependent methyltransferase [Mycena galericulata]
MATFAKTTFNTARYAASRPTYPRTLFDSVLAYHAQSTGISGTSAGWNYALDLGCGTGQATAELLPKASAEEEQEGLEPLGFPRVTGVDPSPKMIEQATAFAAGLGVEGVELNFVTSPAENLKFVGDKSVDLVIAAQAAHWFDWDRMWPELSRVLKYGGTAAFWVYSDFRLPQYPQLTPLITEYAQGIDPTTSLGPHWEPGRRILANHLLDIKEPPTGWDDLTRVFFTGDYYPQLPEPHMQAIMRKTMTWGGAGLHGYLRTFSALHRYHEAFPEDLARADGDIATRFLRTLMENAQVPLGEEGENATVEVEWPMALVLARKELDPEDPWRARHETFTARVTELKTRYDKSPTAVAQSKNVEDTNEKLNKWIAAQGKVLEMVNHDLENLPQEVDEEYEDGRDRYIENMEETRMTVSWHLTFKQAIDGALELATKVEREIGREDRAAGVEGWVQLMREKIEVLGPLPDPDSEEGLSDEQIAQFTEEQMKDLEHAEALEGILHIVKEMAEHVPDEHLTDLLRELYVSAANEVATRVVVE